MVHGVYRVRIKSLSHPPSTSTSCRPTVSRGGFQPIWVTQAFRIRVEGTCETFLFPKRWGGGVCTHVCPPLRLPNTDIRPVVCAAWVMWHQSDLQNSRGGAINHIGSGINHCVEDILCHRCPLTITLRKNARPPPPPPLFSSSSPSILPFSSIASQSSDHRLVSGGGAGRERRPLRRSLKCRLI